MRRLLVTIVAAAGLLAGCGASTPRNVAAAHCLRNVLDNDRSTSECVHGKTVNFNINTGAQSTASPSNTAGKVSCIRQAGNMFLCQTGDGTQYAVDYDGSHIGYSQVQ